MGGQRKVPADLLNLQVTRGLVAETEKWVKQNNSLNIFEEYFLEADPATDTAAPTATTEAVFKDPQWTPERAVSPSCCLTVMIVFVSSLILYSIVKVSGVCWGPDGDKVGVAFSVGDPLAPPAADPSSLVFRYGGCQLQGLHCVVRSLAAPLSPLLRLAASRPLALLQFGRREPELVAGAGTTGQLVLFDCRAGGAARLECQLEAGGEPCTGLAWLHSRTGAEVSVSQNVSSFG